MVKSDFDSKNDKLFIIWTFDCLYLASGLGMGRDREFREFFHRFYGGWKGGLHSDFACLTVQPFMCLAPAATRYKKGI